MGHLPLIILILSMATTSFGVKMEIVHKWKYLDYVWDNPKQKADAINSGNYNVNTCFLNDIDKADGRLIVNYSEYIILNIIMNYTYIVYILSYIFRYC